MTSFIEKLVAIIAPHGCIVCSNYNNILCPACVDALPQLEAPFCVLCTRPTTDWQVCPRCAGTAHLTYVWPFAEYGGAIEEALQAFKFKHARAAADPLAAAICRALPYLSDDWVVAPVPTASPRIRQRGYDQAWLLAREVARRRNLQYMPALRRTGNARQVGASRELRIKQAYGLYELAHDVTRKKILLIDDVCTTGATLMAAARVLTAGGAAEVSAGIVAWQPPS